MDILNVLAVGDPAVYTYKNQKYSIIKSFEQKYGIKVYFHIVPFANYYEEMMETLQKTHRYDIVMVAGHLWLKDFVDKDLLAEVEYPKSKSYDANDILKVIRDEMKVGGRDYLYPSFCDGHLLIYRKSIVKKVIGGKLPEVIDTDTIITLAEQCNGSYGMNGIALKAHSSEIFLDFLPYLRNEGIEPFHEENHLPLFNNEKGIEALKKYIHLKQFAHENTEQFGNDEVRIAFQRKRVCMAVTWGGQMGVVLNDNCIEPEDVGFSAIKTSWNVTWSFAIDQYTRKKLLSNEFLAYLSSKEIDRIVGGTAGSPVRKSTYEADSKNYPWYDIHLKLIQTYAKPLPKMERAGEKLAPLYEHTYKAFIGEETPEEAMKKADREIRQIVG